jgi:hypothetical protein
MVVGRDTLRTAGLFLAGLAAAFIGCGDSGRRNGAAGDPDMAGEAGANAYAGRGGGGASGRAGNDGESGEAGDEGNSARGGQGGAADGGGTAGRAGRGGASGGGGNAGRGGTGAAGNAGGGMTGDSCMNNPPLEQRIVRLSFLEIANAIEALLGADCADQLRTEYGIDWATRGFRPLFAPSEGTTISTPQLQTSDAIASAAGAYVRDHFAMVTGCASPTDVCGRSFVSDFAERAYRRPLATAEVDSLSLLYTDIVDLGGTVEQAVEHGVYAVLSSPYFLYRTEIGRDAESEGLRLEPYEVASQLSFFLTGGPPDRTLLDAAAIGALQSPDEIAPHVGRLLGSGRGRDHFELAFQSYFGLEGFTQTGALSDAMRTESSAFFARQLWTAPIQELVTSRIANVNATLAAHYEVPFPGGVNGFADVTLPLPRSGVLTQGAILNLHSPRAVPRGQWVRSAFLCLSNPSLPDDHGAQPDGGTERERAAYRAASVECRDCHALTDPYGLALQHFDELGAYTAIDASTVLPAELGSRAVADAAELGAAIAASDLFLGCMAKSFFEYALAEGSMPPDDCRVREVVNAYGEDADKTFAGLVRQIASSDTLNIRAEP